MRIQIAILLLAFLSACKPMKFSDEVNQEDIAQNYSVKYDAYSDKTTASQSLTNRGNGILIRGRTQISHNGATDITQKYSEKSGFQPDHEFLYIDNDGKRYKNSISFASIAFERGFNNLNYRSRTTVVWRGDPVAQNETVQIHIKQEPASQNISASERSRRCSEMKGMVFVGGICHLKFSTKKVGDTEIEISGLSEVFGDNLPVQVFLSREKTIPLQEASPAGGVLKASYDTGREVRLQ